MDLDGELVSAVEDFDEDRKAFGIREAGAKDFGAVVCPEFVKGFS